jgi:threonylcarbamoyladenosine tRNA methylthiotransferase CDKAL1
MVDDIEDLLAGVEASVDVASASASSSSSSRQVFPAHYRNKKQYRQEKYGNKPKKSKLERQQERQQQHQAVASSQSGGGKPRIDFDDYDTLALSNGGVSVSHASSSGERERKEKQRAEEGDPNQGSRLPKGHLPGRGKVFLRTWGCSHNSSDGEYMAGQLASEGFELTDNKAEADVWVLNSCTVKNPSQDTFVNAIKDGREMFGVPVVVTGCVPQGQKNHKEWKDLSMIGVQQIDRVAEVVEQAINGNVVQIMDTKKTGGAALDLPKIRKNELIEIIPINTGCLNQCTYCKTKHARGNLRSYPPAEILARVDQVLAQGIKEIWLTSEDTGTYGRDIGHSLPDLLWRIAEKLPMGVMLRVGMTNPPYILEYLGKCM